MNLIAISKKDALTITSYRSLTPEEEVRKKTISKIAGYFQRLLLYSMEGRERTLWSNSSIPINFPASVSRLVTSTSSLDSVGSYQEENRKNVFIVHFFLSPHIFKVNLFSLYFISFFYILKIFLGNYSYKRLLKILILYY